MNSSFKNEISAILSFAGLCVLVIAGIAFMEYRQDRDFKEGKLTIVEPTQGVFARQEVCIDSVGRTVYSKTAFGWPTLFETRDGYIRSERVMPLSPSTGGPIGVFIAPASSEEVAYYRSWFPERK